MREIYPNIYHCDVPWPENAFRLDMAALPMVSTMERHGMLIDRERIVKLHGTLTAEMEEYQAKVNQMVGRSVNLASGDQLSALLYDEMKLKQPGKEKWTKSKTRLTVDADVLKGMKVQHPIVDPILQYKIRDKLRSTYTYSLLNLMDAAGYVHPDINHTGTETGRLACVAHWTQVVTRQGSKSISDVRVGDEVWTHRGRWRKVTATLIRPAEPMYNVRFSNGEVLTCTKDHRLLYFPYERFEKLGLRLPQCGSSLEDVSVSGMSDVAGDRGPDGYYFPKCAVGVQDQTVVRRVQGAVGAAVFGVEDGGEESDVRQNRGPAPQLDWGSGRWIRLSDLLEKRQAPVCASDRDGRSSGIEGTARASGCASHRRESEKQQAGQSGAGHEERPQGNPRSAAEGQYLTRITQIDLAGCFEIYDITVDEDESYLACGVFSHNCSNPNLQNIPARTKLGKLVRKAFIAPPGEVYGTCDLSQIEMRHAAEEAGCQNLKDVFKREEDLYWAVTEKIYKRKFNEEERAGMDPVTGLPNKTAFRQNAKIVALGTIYDISPEGLVDNLLSWDGTIGFLTDGDKTWDYDRHYTRAVEICAAAIRGFFEGYPELLDRRREHHRRARTFGKVWDCFGRHRWIPQVFSTHSWVAGEGLRAAGNMPIQAGCAGFLKLWMAKIYDRWESHWRRYGLKPVMAVHDEVLVTGPKPVVEDYLIEAADMVWHLLPPDIYDTPLESSIATALSWGELEK